MIKALLDESGRSPDLLVDVAVVMRELGDWDEARSLSEEAYRGAKSKELRYKAALARALSCDGAPDCVDWLKKGDPDSLNVSAETGVGEGM
ncbi:MAG: hypothetical protein R3F11_03745 [Verrucomicrobiales bacterium]